MKNIKIQGETFGSQVVFYIRGLSMIVEIADKYVLVTQRHAEQAHKNTAAIYRAFGRRIATGISSYEYALVERVINRQPVALYELRQLFDRVRRLT